MTTLFLPWLFVNFAGWLAIVGILSGLGVLLAARGVGNSDYVFVVALAVSGCVLGALQWLVLQRRLPVRLSWWLSATVVGCIAGGMGAAWANLLDLAVVPSFPGGPILEWDALIGGALLGVAIGACQGVAWWPRPELILGWIVANTLGWAAGLFLADVTGYLLNGSAGEAQLLLRLVAGVLAGLATGLVLIWPRSAGAALATAPPAGGQEADGCA